MRYLIHVLLVGLVLSYGCAHTSANRTDQPTSSKGHMLDASKYFPLKVGAYWKYKAVRGKDSIEWTRKIVRIQDGEYIDSEGAHFASDPLGVRDQVRYFIRSNVSPGFKWWAQLDYRRRQYLQFLSNSEAVSVPAGKFENCLLIEAKMTLPGSRKWIERAWYAKGVGMVKRTIMVSGPKGELLLHENAELAEFELP